MSLFKNWSFKCTGPNGFNNAQVTAGGIDTNDIEKMKNSLDEHKRKFTLLKKQYEDELANISEDGDNERLVARNKLVDNLADINLELEMLNNTEMITYDDIASDYTKLFEWMF